MSKRYPYHHGHWYTKLLHKIFGCPRDWRKHSRRLNISDLWQCKCGKAFKVRGIKK